MRKFIFHSVLFASMITFCNIDTNAQNNTQKKFTPIVTDSINSKILKEKCAYTVLLPNSYNQNPQKEYPVLYLLHGLGGDNEDWTRKGELKRVMDKLVKSGEVNEMIVIMPKAGGDVKKDIWNGYFNMPDWNYEDFFFTELMPEVESKYRIKKDRKHRGIAGLSMGGGGSTVYAQRHPELFSACYAMSALMSFPDDGGLPAKGSKKMEALNQSVKDLSAVKFVNNANPETIENLRNTKWFVDCGDDDFLFDTNIDFYNAMKSKWIPCELRIRDGVHNWEYWNTALYTALPFFSRNFNKED